MGRERAKVIWLLGLVGLQALLATGCRAKRAGTAGQDEPDESVPESFGGGAPNDSNTGKAGYGGAPAVPAPGSAGTADSSRVRLPSLDTTITVPAAGGSTSRYPQSAGAGTGAPSTGGGTSPFTSNDDNRGLNGSYGATASSTAVRPPTPIASPGSLSTPAMRPGYSAPAIPPPTIWPVTPVVPGSSSPPPPPKPPGGL